jgi:hypothetical protein
VPEEGPLVVVALDRRTGEPVRFVEVEFAAPHHPRARVRTDRLGRARSPDTLPAGGLSLRARDLLSGRRIERKAILHQPDPRGGAAERTWKLHLGPTYGLRVDAGEAALDGPEAGPLRARLGTVDPWWCGARPPAPWPPTGWALVEAGAPIESFHVEAPGWTTVAVQRFRGHAETPDGLGFVLMTRE